MVNSANVLTQCPTCDTGYTDIGPGCQLICNDYFYYDSTVYDCIACDAVC